MGRKKNANEVKDPIDAREEQKEHVEPKKDSRESKYLPAVEKKSNLGDSGTMKRLMDDAAINVMLDNEDGLGYEEDTSLSNLKLVIGFASVGASLVSHAYPATFPKNWWVLLWCVTFYFVGSGILQFMLSFMELESILLVSGKKDAQGRRRSGLNMHSHFPRFQEMYTLGVTMLPKGSLSLAFAPQFNPAETGPHNRQWSVAEFFDENEIFHEESFEREVKAFLLEYEASVNGK